MKRIALFTMVLAVALAFAASVSADECQHTYAWRMIGTTDHQEYCTKCGYVLRTGDHTQYCDVDNGVCKECGALASDGYEIHHAHRQWEGVDKDTVTTWEQGGSNGDYHVVYCSACGEVAMNEHHQWNSSGVCSDCGISITAITHFVFCSNPGYCANCESGDFAKFNAPYDVLHFCSLGNWEPDPDDDTQHIRVCPNTGLAVRSGSHDYNANGVCQTCGFKDPYIIGLSKTSATVKHGQTVQISATQKDNTRFTYTSSDNSVAAVSSTGVVTAKKAGTAVITVKGAQNRTATFKVTVPATKITLNKTAVTLKAGKTFTITASQAGTAGAKFTYSSGNRSVATVDKNGKVTAKKPGTAVITVTSSYGETATVKITVASVKITGVKSSITLKVKDKFTLQPVQTGTVGATFTFKTSDKKIATVDKTGRITAKKAGKCTITITSCFGETLTIKIKVK